MLKRSCLLVLLVLVPSPSRAQKDDDSAAQDIQYLKKMGQPTDGKGLLQYFRQRTFKEADPAQVTRLVEQLGDDDFFAREEAFRNLLALGSRALSGVKQAENHADTEIRKRVLELKARIESKTDPAIQSAAARVVARQKPADAASVLLAFLPFADPLAIDDLCKALGAVAEKNGSADPAIVSALKDQHPLKRGGAGEAIVRAKIQNQLPQVRELLKDPEPVVRLRIALALAQQKEKDALPVLVELFAQLNADQLFEVEELFLRLASPNPPNVSLGTNETTRKAARDAWHTWLTKNEKELEEAFAKLEDNNVFLGFTLVVQQRINRVPGGPFGGEVIELDAGRNVRWRVPVDRYPVDAQVVGKGRVLVAEYQGGRVTERLTANGDIKWEKAVGGNPIGVQRLPNGNTFVVMQNRLVEYDRNGNEVYSFNRPNHDIFRARKLENGELVYITNQGVLSRLDKNKAVKKTFHVSNIPILFGSIDVLPDGGVLVPDFQQNRVVEYTQDGTQKKVFSVPQPNSAVRLPNGHTLVASQNTRNVIEFNPQGQEVWRYSAEGMVFNARKR